MLAMTTADAEPIDFRLCTAPALAAAVLLMPVVTDTAHQVHMFLLTPPSVNKSLAESDAFECIDPGADEPRSLFP